MINKKHVTIFMFTILILSFNTSFISAMSRNLEKENDLLDIEKNNYPLESSALLAYWNLDEGSGSVAYDSSGHMLHGIIHGPEWTEGYSGYALDFDGTLDYILLDEHIDELGFNKTDDYKVSAWIKSDSISAGYIFMISDNNDDIPVFYIKRENNGTIEAKVQSTETCVILIKSDKEYHDDAWHFLEVIYHGNEGYPDMELYVDNELVANGSDWLCPLIANAFSRAKIGMASYDSLFMYTGQIDEIKVYKRPGGNQLPNKPQITGPTTGTIGETYHYTFSISDPEGDELYLWVDWGDNTNTSWLGPYDSGESVVLSHSWLENGAFEIKARTRDAFDVSEWGKLNVAMGNIAPTIPTVDGPNLGNKGQQLEYTFKSKDLNGHDIKYHIDWGDGTITEWTDFNPSNEEVTVKHVYNHQGVYSIKANAVDIYEKESGWSNPFMVNVTEKAMLFGIISNKISDDNVIYFNAKLLLYIGLKPFKTSLYSNEEQLLISYDYLGNITDNLVYGVFNTAII